MAQDPRDRGEEFNLDLEWPKDIGPLVPAAPRGGSALDQGDGVLPAPRTTTRDSIDLDDDTEAEEPAEPGLSSADRQRRAFVETLNPSMTELVGDFDSLVSTIATFGHVVDGRLRAYLDEVALMDTVSSGHLKRYRDDHLRALTKLRHLVGDSPAWEQWLAESIKEMVTAVDDAVEAIHDLSQEARASVTRSAESVKQMTDAARWLGEQLESNLTELHKVVSPESADGDGAAGNATGDGRAAIQRALSRLAESQAERGKGETRLEEDVAQLLDELRGSGGGGGEVLDAVARLAEEIREAGPEALREEVARLGEEIRALRRRLNLRARTPVALEADQLEAIAQAVADTIGTRRRPLEAPGRTNSRTTRR